MQGGCRFRVRQAKEELQLNDGPLLRKLALQFLEHLILADGEI